MGFGKVEIMIILALVVSLLPLTLLYLWLSKLKKEDEGYRTLCRQALLRGFRCVLPVVLLSGVSSILLGLTGLKTGNPLLYQALYTFIVLALMEEIAKVQAFRHVVKKTEYPYSWLDCAVLLSIVSIGFSLIESVIYAIGASIPVILVRGICLPHAGYGFLEGYYYGKSRKTGKPWQKWIGFVLAWLLHGLYDFSLSEEFVAVNDNLVIVALLLAVAEIVLVILLIRFVKKNRKKEEYTEPLEVKAGEEIAAAANEAPAENE